MIRERPARTNAGFPIMLKRKTEALRMRRREIWLI